jgi:hypothetical protein
VTATPSEQIANDRSGEDILTLGNTSSISSMSITINIVQTSGATPGSEWSDFPGSVSESESTSGGVMTYTFIVSGTAYARNPVFTVTAQWATNGIAHSTSGDTYSVTSTVGAVQSTLTGSF